MTTPPSDRYAWFDAANPGEPNLAEIGTDPRQKPWGLLYEFDTGAPMAASTYTWHESPEAVAHLLRESLPYASGRLGADEVATRQQAMEPALARLVGCSPPCATIAKELDEIGGRDFGVLWLGPFELLRNGGGVHEQGIREIFRARARDDAADLARPIADDEVDAFAEFLQDLVV